MQGALFFVAPALLVAAAALPLLYLLLRLLPPAPRRVQLPSFKLLGGADLPPPPSARPPWWLLLLRISIAALFILGLAGPRWQPPRTAAPPARLAIVIDNGWSATSQWEQMIAAAEARLEAAAPTTRIAVLPTTSVAAPPPPRFVDAATARAQLDAIVPLPWPGDRAALAARLPSDAAYLWIADGVEDGHAPALRRKLQGAEIISLAPDDPVFRIAGRTRTGWSAQFVRYDGAATGTLTVSTASGARIHREPLTFNGNVATTRFPLDVGDRSRAARLTVGSGSIAATYLADGSSNRPRVVIVEGPSNSPPLESGAYYVRRALEPHADVASASLAAAAGDPATFFVLVDVVADAAQAEALNRRIEGGAVAVVFAGPRIAENGSALSPVPLRSGERALGGVLSWQKPQAIGGFAADSPLAGLPLGGEARVSRQLLAGGDAEAGRWAWLADGTPIVSAARRGAGLVILVHTAADPSWSSLPLTGVFEMMLRRLLPLAENPRETDISASKPWVLERMLGARGNWQDPPRHVQIAAGDFDTSRASAATPPGIYRSGKTRRMLNFTTALGPAFTFTPLRTDGLRPATRVEPPVDIGRWLLLVATLLAAFDLFIALRLRGVLAPIFAVAALFMINPAEAADDMQIAYVRTGGAGDVRTARGLEMLGAALARRTSVEPAKPVAVDPARDQLGRFPVIYWPAYSARTMSAPTAERLRDYVARGGLVLFDFGRPLGAGSGARELLEPLGLPALAEVGPDHVLSKSFYILPGFIGGAVWAEAGTSGASGRVSGVVIGGGDWAAIWAGDKPVSPSQRDAAFRFGINVVMYALTGTYKSDQVHTRALLDRLGEPER